MHGDAGLEAQSRDWEHEPRGGWDDFQAARRRHLIRLAAQSDGLDRNRAAQPDGEPWSRDLNRARLALADHPGERPDASLVHTQQEVLIDPPRQARALVDQAGLDLHE